MTLHCDNPRVMEISDVRYWWRKYCGWARNDQATPDVIMMRRTDTEHGCEEFVANARGHTIKLYTIHFQWFVKFNGMTASLKSFRHGIDYMQAMYDVIFYMEGDICESPIEELP